MASLVSDDSFPRHFKGVRDLLDTGFDRVPDLYIRPQDERPNVKLVNENEQLPVIDLSRLQGGGRARIVEEIGRACEEWGFFQVVNHGIAPDLMDRMHEVGQAFFALPTHEKMRYFSTDVKSHMRYGTSFNVREDTTLNWRDFLRFTCFPLEDMMPLWPDKPTDFRTVTADFCTQVRGLIEALLQAISESLGLNADYIANAFGTYSQIMAINYYPECPIPDLTLGIPPHSDPGGISLLIQDDVGGLQICHNDSWVPVQPIPHAFVVNIADQLQVATKFQPKHVFNLTHRNESASRR
eukprot:c206_g1_i1 orf=537-1424(-)